MISQSSYRTLLNREYLRRKERNPAYSLRSFSRDCGLSPSHMSDILAERYGLSTSRAKDIAARLCFDEETTTLFLLLVESVHARSALAREEAVSKLSELKVKPDIKVSEQVFSVVANWYHFAILELIKTRSFQPNAEWIADSLRISTEEATEALNRLSDLKLIEYREGKPVPSQNFAASSDGVPSEAIRQYHRQLLNKATDAIEAQSVEERDFSAMNFVVEKSRLPELKAQIRDFRRQLAKSFEAKEPGEEVYCYTTQLFRLNQVQ